MAPSVGRVRSPHGAAESELLNLHRSALPRLEGIPDAFDLACWSQPADSIGGDLIVAWPVDGGRLGVCLIDVMGHGTPAAVVASSVRTALHPSRALGLCRPAELLDELNLLVGSLFPGYFVTATVCLVDAEARSLTFAQAGHPALLIRGEDGDVRPLSTPAAPLGLADERYAEHIVRLDEGAVVVVYSDGISDALADSETSGTLALSAVVGGCEKRGALRLVERICRAVRRAAPVQDDDRSLFAVRLL